MNIRSITCFVNLGHPAAAAAGFSAAGDLARRARAALEAAGFPVQTARLATQPLSLLPGAPPATEGSSERGRGEPSGWNPLSLAVELEAQASAAGFDYLSLGPVLADHPDADLSPLDHLPDLIAATETLFVGVLAARAGRGLHLEAIRQAARAVHHIAHRTDQGFGNLRLALLANVPPLTPFFPAAYHDGGPPALALATESADLAVSALSPAGSLAEARDRLVAAVEGAAGQIGSLVCPLAERDGVRFAGIDFSLAPFPEEARSIGTAVERLGVDRFGAPGTLFAASFLTDCLRRARYPRCGFNGLMLPALEDAVLATRSHERLFTVNDLLLYSAVCGTGLDTIPLPGDVTEDELAGILLDVAALALRLDKPLTARLMPIPGARAGDLTAFDFSYFANGRVLDVKGRGSPALFARGPWLPA